MKRTGLLRPSKRVITDMQKPETTRFTIDVEASIHREFKAWCASNSLKMAEVLREMIVERMKPKP